MTKYSCTFYHEMIELYNIPFTDIAISSSEESYRSENGLLVDWYIKACSFKNQLMSCRN